MDKVVFLDRDGTINVEKNYLYKVEDFEFIKGAPEAIKLLNENNYRVVVISNQAGVARGYYTHKDVDKLHDHIQEELKKCGAHIDEFYYCPHHPTEGIDRFKCICNCRKPEIGLFLKAEEKYVIDKEKSWMIGDNRSDIIAGNRYGVRTILVSTGYGKDTIKDKDIQFNKYVSDILEAAKFVISNQKETFND